MVWLIFCKRVLWMEMEKAVWCVPTKIGLAAAVAVGLFHAGISAPRAEAAPPCPSSSAKGSPSTCPPIKPYRAVPEIDGFSSAGIALIIGVLLLASERRRAPRLDSAPTG
jgi:hypothetical protein